MDRQTLLDRTASSGEERTLLARVLDKYEQMERRNIPTATVFLSESEQAAAVRLLNAAGIHSGFVWNGGYPGAGRKLLQFLPDWAEEGGSPIACIRASFRGEGKPTHRDCLGSLMALGITREKLGDILVLEGKCQVVVLREALPILVSQWESVGRWKVSVEEIPLRALTPKPPTVKTIRDTVAALRLDAVLAAGFSTSRSKAADFISAGRVSVNHRECMKGDRTVAEGDVLSCRGLGKCVVKEVLGASKKGRIMLVLERYI